MALHPVVASLQFQCCFAEKIVVRSMAMHWGFWAYSIQQ